MHQRNNNKPTNRPTHRPDTGTVTPVHILALYAAALIDRHPIKLTFTRGGGRVQNSGGRSGRNNNYFMELVLGTIIGHVSESGAMDDVAFWVGRGSYLLDIGLSDLLAGVERPGHRTQVRDVILGVCGGPRTFDHMLINCLITYQRCCCGCCCRRGGLTKTRLSR